MSEMSATLTIDKARQTVEAAGQGHVLHYFDELGVQQQNELLQQVGTVDWSQLTSLIEKYVKHKPEFQLPANIEPAPSYSAKPQGDEVKKQADARKRGEALIAAGKVAAFTVAGGQGTRLGWDGPKGTYPASPIRKTTLFELFAQQIKKTQDKYHTTVPWYIMTSQVNDEPTRAFFNEHDYFGLDKANVMLFPQEMMPAMDRTTGEVLLDEKGSIALSPNGHGGSLKALWTSGAIADMKKRGVEQISYIQIDNPNVKVIDPLFIGLHDVDNAQMSSKMLPKAYAREKLGNFCVVDGKITVIEYSDLPDELAEQTTPDGALRFRAGSIAIHAIRVDFVESLNTREGGFGLPWHRADKKVPFIDSTGQRVEPTEPNAVKLETFVFDALPLCETSIILETNRIEEFAPIKNAEGVDSPASSRQLQSERAGCWLEHCGVQVPRNSDGHVDAVIDLSPLTAVAPEDLKDGPLPAFIDSGAEVVL